MCTAAINGAIDTDTRESCLARWPGGPVQIPDKNIHAVPSSSRLFSRFLRRTSRFWKGVIPAERHKAITKQARKTNHIERFNNTLRQRLSRLVRDTLSFSKKVENHIGAIKFFICHYNLEKAAALPV